MLGSSQRNRWQSCIENKTNDETCNPKTKPASPVRQNGFGDAIVSPL
jgi:hypothetical protein